MKPCTIILDNDIQISANIETPLPKIKEDNTCECMTLHCEDIITFQTFIDSIVKDLKIIVKYDCGTCTIRNYDLLDISKNYKDLSIMLRFKEMLTSFE
jgi:hypothetical protein